MLMLMLVSLSISSPARHGKLTTHDRYYTITSTQMPRIHVEPIYNSMLFAIYDSSGLSMESSEREYYRTHTADRRYNLFRYNGTTIEPYTSVNLKQAKSRIIATRLLDLRTMRIESNHIFGVTFYHTYYFWGTGWELVIEGTTFPVLDFEEREFMNRFRHYQEYIKYKVTDDAQVYLLRAKQQTHLRNYYMPIIQGHHIDIGDALHLEHRLNPVRTLGNAINSYLEIQERNRAEREQPHVQQSIRQSQLREIYSARVPDSIILASPLTEQVGKAKQAIPKYVAELLKNDLISKGESCSISMNPFKDSKDLQVTPCYHVFDGASLRKWLTTKSSCPLCKQVVTLDVLTAV